MSDHSLTLIELSGPLEVPLKGIFEGSFSSLQATS